MMMMMMKHRRKWWCASDETITMINFHHPLLSLLSFKEIDDPKLYKITPPEEIWLINLLMSKHPALKQRLQAQIDSACAFGV